MINSRDLNRCIDILAELHAHAISNKDKNLTLELGYIIKQELDLVKEWENKHNEYTKMQGGELMNINRLLEDNTQLYKENEILIKSLNKLKEIVEHKIPNIQDELIVINKKFDFLNNHIETNLC